MFTTLDNTTVIILLIALGIIGWGYYRSRSYGKLGFWSWLQSVTLMAPWLLFFGLTATGVYINLVSILALFLVSTGFYIILGRKLREAAHQETLNPKIELKPHDPESSTEPNATNRTDPTNEASEPTIISLDTQPAAIPAEDIETLKGIFGVDTFFATETLPYQEGVIFKGNLRSDPEQAYDHLSNNLQEKMGDRFRLFLVESPEEKPVVIILPRGNDPKSATVGQKILAVILLLVTVATTFEAGGFLLGFDFFEKPTRYPEILPIVLGVSAVLFAHELGHQLMARQHQVRFSWPFFIPTVQLGTFGAFNRFESLLPNRKVLFDVAFAGPAAGGILSFTMLVIGLVLSNSESVFKIPTEFFHSSVLIGTLARTLMGSALNQPVVPIHPLTIIGWLGLVITAINLMPAGQLDGGRIMQAIYGRKIAGRATLATFAVLAIASLINPLALYWAVVILILQRNLERPSLNELVEPSDTQAALGLLALLLMIVTLFPLTPALASRLGIG